MGFKINIQISDEATFEAFIEKMEEIGKEHSGNCTLLGVWINHYEACSPAKSETKQTVDSLGSINISDSDSIDSAERLKLVQELDKVVGKYTDQQYRVNLIFPESK